MRIFLTGATGYIGGAVASALRRHGHEVAALVRPDSDSGALREEGVFVVGGDLAALPDLRDTLAQYDAVVHTAFNPKDPVASDKTAVDVFTSLQSFFLFTSGIWVLGNGKSDEDTPVKPLPLVAWRPAHEQQVLESGRGAVLRPGTVYGGRQSVLASWFAAAEAKGPLQVVGDGRNRWAMVHLADLADCYVRIVEQRKGGVFHAVDDSADTVDETVRAIAPSGAIEHVPYDAAKQKMGPFTDALVVDQRIASEKTRRALGWKPMHNFTGSIDEQWREWRSAQKGE